MELIDALAILQLDRDSLGEVLPLVIWDPLAPRMKLKARKL
jgi:hypothetical protein